MGCKRKVKVRTRNKLNVAKLDSLIPEAGGAAVGRARPGAAPRPARFSPQGAEGGNVGRETAARACAVSIATGP